MQWPVATRALPGEELCATPLANPQDAHNARTAEENVSQAWHSTATHSASFSVNVSVLLA
jgi:hypothetical protein